MFFLLLSGEDTAKYRLPFAKNYAKVDSRPHLHLPVGVRHHRRRTRCPPAAHDVLIKTVRLAMELRAERDGRPAEIVWTHWLACLGLTRRATTASVGRARRRAEEIAVTTPMRDADANMACRWMRWAFNLLSGYATTRSRTRWCRPLMPDVEGDRRRSRFGTGWTTSTVHHVQRDQPDDRALEVLRDQVHARGDAARSTSRRRCATSSTTRGSRTASGDDARRPPQPAENAARRASSQGSFAVTLVSDVARTPLGRSSARACRSSLRTSPPPVANSATPARRGAANGAGRGRRRPRSRSCGAAMLNKLGGEGGPFGADEQK